MTKLWDHYAAMPDVLLLELARDSGNELAIALGKRLAQEIAEREAEVAQYEGELAALSDTIQHLKTQTDMVVDRLERLLGRSA